MVRFTNPLLLAATLATITPAAPTSTGTGFTPFQDPDMDDPSIIFNQLIDDNTSINETATALMATSTKQSNDQRSDNARSGLGDLQDEQALVSQMLNGLVDAGDNSQNGNFQIISAADKKTVGFYQTVINQPALDVALDCGVAIACQRNGILDTLSQFVNKYNEVVNNNTDTPAYFPPTNLVAPNLVCDSTLQFCFQ